MTIRRTNPRKQGEIGLGAAIAWFLAEGYGVAIPLCDNQAWDLVVDSEADGLEKVQVKTTVNLCDKYEQYRRARWHIPETAQQLVVGGGFEPP